MYAHRSAEHDLPRNDFECKGQRNSEVSDDLQNPCFFNNNQSQLHPASASQNEIQYQGEAIAVGVHERQPEVEFSNFLALQISNAVLQTLDSNHVTPSANFQNYTIKWSN